MDHSRRTRTAFGHLHPPVFGELGVDDPVLVREHAGGRDLERLGHLQDQVRLAMGPTLDPLQWLGQIPGVTSRHATVHPRGDGIDLFAGQPAFAGEVAVTRVGVPRGHAALLSDFLDHAAMLDGVSVGQQRKRRGLFRPMADLTTGLEDWSHMLAEGDVGHRTGLAVAVDQAAVGFRFGDADLLAGQHFFDRPRQVVARRLRPTCGHAVTVIDTATVVQHMVAVENHDGGNPGDAQGIRQLLMNVLEDQERRVALVGVAGDLAKVVRLVRVNTEKLDVFVTVFLLQRD